MGAVAKKQKPGRVIRIDPVIEKYVSQHSKPKETISATLRRLMGLPPRKGVASSDLFIYILPESRIVCETIEEARGEAIVRAIRRGKKKPTEKPVRARIINE